MPRHSMITVNGEDKTIELLNFAGIIGLDRVAPDRYSALLLIQLFAGMTAQGPNPAKVIREIEALEGYAVPTGTKPAEPFKHPPLKGLWHKHHLADGLRSLARNLRNGLRSDGVPTIARMALEAEEAGEVRYMTRADIACIVQDAVVDNYERRAAANAMTGEWLIFAKHEGRNYYLSLGEHTAGDAVLRAGIDAMCVHEFPFLRDILDRPA